MSTPSEEALRLARELCGIQGLIEALKVYANNERTVNINTPESPKSTAELTDHALLRILEERNRGLVEALKSLLKEADDWSWRDIAADPIGGDLGYIKQRHAQSMVDVLDCAREALKKWGGE